MTLVSVGTYLCRQESALFARSRNFGATVVLVVEVGRIPATFYALAKKVVEHVLALASDAPYHNHMQRIGNMQSMARYTP